jgi:hypothetical protein
MLRFSGNELDKLLNRITFKLFVQNKQSYFNLSATEYCQVFGAP